MLRYRILQALRLSLLRGSAGLKEILSKSNVVNPQAWQRQHLLGPWPVRQLHCCSENTRHKIKNVVQCSSLQHAADVPVANPVNCSPSQNNQAHYNSGLHTDIHRHYSTLEERSTTSHQFYRLLQTLPQGIQMAFAYGSGVYQQEGHKNMRANMLDFILVVDDPRAWHDANIKMNYSHYSFLKYFSTRGIAHLQELGAGVYFNTLVPFEDRRVKYGVISTERLITDLLDWDTLYVSGRLHKPVKLLVLPSNPDLIFAMQVNLQSAVHAALLLLPEDFCEEALYTTIAGLSYNGDFRMVVGEDRNKVANIVRPNMPHFRLLYESILESEEHVQWYPLQGRLEQNLNHVTQFHHLQLLPKTVLLLLQENRTRPGSHPDLEEVLKIYANSSHCDDTVARCISHIVWRSSLTQTAKTALTAGAMKSVVYSFRKLKKMWRGKPKLSSTQHGS